MINYCPADPAAGSWRTSTFSLGNGQCVEVANIEFDGVAVRDSKHPDGGALIYHPSSWNRFIGGVKAAA